MGTPAREDDLLLIKVAEGGQYKERSRYLMYRKVGIAESQGLLDLRGVHRHHTYDRLSSEGSFKSLTMLARMRIGAALTLLVWTTFDSIT